MTITKDVKREVVRLHYSQRDDDIVFEEKDGDHLTSTVKEAYSAARRMKEASAHIEEACDRVAEWYAEHRDAIETVYFGLQDGRISTYPFGDLVP